MMFEHLAHRCRFIGMMVAAAVALPAGSAGAATHGQPTAVTITPQFATTLSDAGSVSPASAGVEVAQNRRRQARREFQRERRQLNRERRRLNRRAVRQNRLYRHGRWYHYRDGGYYDNTGAALAVGAIGLAAGALLGSALANSSQPQTVILDSAPAPYTAEWYRRCDLKYRSFRASDGTFLGYDGIRRTCVLP